MTWLTTSEFERYTGIVSSSDIVQNALDFAEKDIIRHIFVSQEYLSANSSSLQQIWTPIMSIDGNLTITTTDIEAWEIDQQGFRYSLATSLVSVDEFSGWVTFTSEVPTIAGRTTQILYKTGRDWFQNMIRELQELEKLIAVNYLYEDVIHKKMSGGISSWTINGVSVSFDANGMAKVIDDNKKKIAKMMAQLRPKRFDTFKPGFMQHHPGFLLPPRASGWLNGSWPYGWGGP